MEDYLQLRGPQIKQNQQEPAYRFKSMQLNKGQKTMLRIKLEFDNENPTPFVLYIL